MVALLESEDRHAGEEGGELVSELEERRVPVDLKIERVPKGRAEADDAAVATVHDMSGLGSLDLHGRPGLGCAVLFCEGGVGEEFVLECWKGLQGLSGYDAKLA